MVVVAIAFVSARSVIVWPFRVEERKSLRSDCTDHGADVVAFLVSDDARWLTGQNVRSTGGWEAGW